MKKYNVLAQAAKALLIVDDIEANRKALASVFEDTYQIYEASNGVEALRLLETGLPCCAIILDLMMPEMDGFALLEKLKADASLAQIPVVVNTVYGEDENEIKALKLGAQDFIFKPYNAELIRHRVENVIAQSTSLEASWKNASLQTEKELLEKAVAGGVMGGYMEPNFPFYFINHTMLSYLGYSSEREFVEDNSGFISNCMHPDDKGMVDKAVEAQLTSSDEYTVEYRMRKKNGSYIWVHDVGKVITAENGKPAILSVCYDITAAVEARQKLQKSQYELNDALSNMPGGLIIMKIHEGLGLTPTFISDGFCKMLDITKEEAFSLYGSDAMAGVHPDDRDKLWKQLQENYRLGATVGDGVYRLSNGKGSYIWIKNSSHLVEHGKSKLLYSTYTDLSHQVELQFQLETTTKDMKAIVDNIPGGVVKIAFVGNKIVPAYISDGWCKMMGDTKENLMAVYAENAMNGVHPEDYDRVFNDFTSAMKSGESIDSNYRVCNSRGEYRWINNRSSLISDEKGIVNYYAVYTDITDEVAAKEKAEKASKEIELIYNSIPGAVFKCRFNADWDVIFANDGLFRFLGYTREEFKTLFQNKMAGVIYPDDGAIMVDKISQQLKHGTTVRNENRLICKDGSVKWISIHAELLEDENHEKYFYCTFVEVTDRKRAEAELANTQQKLTAAIDHAGLDYWEYDIINSRAYLNSVSTNEFGLQGIMENYPQSAFESGRIAQESIQELNNMIDAIKSGEPSVVGDVKTVDANGEIVWKRIRFTTLFDEHQKPFWAVATAENIDDYKNLEQQFSIAAEQTGVESWIYDMSSKTLTRTSNALTKSSAPIVVSNVPESLVEQKIVHPDDAAAFCELYQKLQNGVPNASLQLRMYRADSDSYVYHRMDYTVLFDKLGRPERAIGTSVDISEQMLLQQRYQETVELHHKTTSKKMLISGYGNISKNAMLELDTANGVDYIAKFGRSRDVFFINFASRIVDEHERKEFLDKFLSASILKAYANGATNFTTQCKMMVDNHYYKHVKVVIDVLKQPATGDLMGFLLITDETADTIYDKAIDAVVEKYCDWIVDVDINQDYYTMLIVQDGLVNVPPPNGKFSRINEEYARTFADEQSMQDCIEKLSYPYIIEHLDREGSYWFYYRIHENDEVHTKKIQVFYIDKALGHIGFIRLDVTATLLEEQQKNEALKHALVSSERANKAKTEFLSRMSHDIRTPMNAIIGMTQLAKQEIDHKDKVLENLDVIDASSKLLLRIINNVLDMSQIESGNLTLVQETFDCQTECRNVIEISQVMFEAKQQIFTVIREFEHRYFVGDIVRVKRVIMNLLNNASKFSPRGGQIKLTAREEKTLNPQIANLIFVVSDSGIGIPKDKINAIFQPFEQLETHAKYEGTGLGLPIVKSIVETKGGTISVESEVGHGSTFTVTLPMRIAEESEPQSQEIPKSEPPCKIDFSHLNVLLVEDHPINTLVAKRLLEKYGAQVDTAENGLMGYDKLTQSKAGQYNIIFMDIQMPVMNGYESAKAIRQSAHPQAKTIPIIAMTANAFAEDIQRSLASGMNGHIAKPISIEAIAQAVGEGFPLNR